MGAVSPAARDTCRITPVRMPAMEFGSTIVRIVCQRLAPMFQQASRNDRGTAASASRVLVMMTGSVITASVQDAASTQRPIPAKSTNAPTIAASTNITRRSTAAFLRSIGPAVNRLLRDAGRSAMLPAPDPLDDEIGRQIHDERDHHQQAADGEQYPVVQPAFDCLAE